MNMQSYHKIMLSITWICSVILSLLCLLRKAENIVLIQTSATMFSCCILTTIIYFLHISDVIKGTISPLIIFFGTITLSILQGGNERCFMVSYIIIGVTGIYFNSRIIICYSLFSIATLFILFFINPSYIGGNNNEISIISIKIFVYITLCITIFSTNKKGEFLVKKAQNDSISLEKQKQSIQESSNIIKNHAMHLNETIHKSNNDINTVHSDNKQIVTSSEQITAVITTTAESLTLINEKIVLSEQNIQKNYDLALSLNNSYKTVMDHINIGNTQSKKVQNSIQNIEQTILAAQDSTISLLNSTHSIDSILDEIDYIAEQTNLLSLNASIEAAKAKEHGKGFAVVAEEIRVLSEQSQTASTNVKIILGELTHIIKQTSDNVSLGNDSVSSGKADLNQLVTELNDINNSSLASAKIINTEFDLIINIKNDYNIILSEIENIVALSEKISAMMININTSISSQSNAVNMLTKSLNDLNKASEKLDTN